MKLFWKNLGLSARIGLVTGALLIAVMTLFISWWLLRSDYQVLFADLRPQDAAAMTAELDRLKIPYAIDENAKSGTVILVDKSIVHATRIKLMGKDLPLQGAVGFELFNNTDFGMTEFAQKINYQRALQGELTRTILSLHEIRDARVHLALPEQGLFKQGSTKAKASITLSLRQDQALRPEQILGIQRLVAAAVPNMLAQDVTIVDGNGIALNKAISMDGNGAPVVADSDRLNLKQETENYLSKKVTAVLERTFGAGQVTASVDVILDMDQVKVVTEDVIAAPDKNKYPATGVVVRERESTRDSAGPLDTKSSQVGDGSNMQREVDYQVGRRVEQVVSQPGSIRGIQVVAVVHKALDSHQENQVRDMIAAASGAMLERGDKVVVYSFGALQAEELTSTTTNLKNTEAETVSNKSSLDKNLNLPIVILVLMAIGLLIYTLFNSFYRRGSINFSEPLSEKQREALMRQVQAWIHPEVSTNTDNPEHRPLGSMPR